MSQSYPPQQYPPPPPPPQYPPPAPQTSSTALIGLIASILGFFMLPVVGSIVGIVAGNSARNEIRNRPGQLTGEGMAQAAVILGWIGLVLAVGGVCLGLLFFGGALGIGACAMFQGGRRSLLPLLPVASVVLVPVLLKLKR